MHIEDCNIWDYALLCQTLSNACTQHGIQLSHASSLAVLLEVSEYDKMPCSVTACCFLIFHLNSATQEA